MLRCYGPAPTATDAWQVARIPLKNAGYPSIRTKALSRHRSPVRCVSTACLSREVEDQSSGRFTLHRQMAGNYAPPTIDTATTSTMMLPCGHPAYCWMRERPFNPSVWFSPTRGTRGLLSIWAIGSVKFFVYVPVKVSLFVMRSG